MPLISSGMSLLLQPPINDLINKSCFTRVITTLPYRSGVFTPFRSGSGAHFAPNRGPDAQVQVLLDGRRLKLFIHVMFIGIIEKKSRVVI